MLPILSWIFYPILFLLTISFLLYIYVTRNFNYWKKRNVLYLKPLPFFGNIKDVFTMKKTIGEWMRDIYNETNTPLVGIFVFDKPVLVIKSPELIKHILIKDFDNFVDRAAASSDHDNIERHFLFFMKNPRWNTVRGQLSRNFSVGKLKMMFPVVTELDMDTIKGTGFTFFLGGFDTVSTTFSFALHELCLNKNIQNKVREEILTVINDKGGLTYEAIFEMKYLDMVLRETMRKYPAFPFLDRRSLNDYLLPSTDLLIEKGATVLIPMFGLHYDEKYFPEPEKFLPERFAGTDYSTDGSAYLPFGEGPRACIGKKFALWTIKLGIISILTKFELEECAGTPDPVEFEAKSLILQSKVGLPMTFKQRV